MCRQSTVIPASNFVDELKHTVKDIGRSGRKAYYDAAGKPYVTCGKCNFHVNVDKASVSSPKPADADAAAPAAAAPVEGAPAAEGAPESAPAAVPGGAPAEGTYNGDNIVCPNCRNPIEN